MKMKKRLKKHIIAPLLIFGLIFSLACSFADLAVAGNALRGSPSPAFATATLTVSPTKTAISPTATALAAYTVCTGFAEGKLYVRSNAGTSFSVLSYLTEGTQVTVVDEIILSDGSRWVKLLMPSGWVNAHYLCK